MEAVFHVIDLHEVFPALQKLLLKKSVFDRNSRVNF